VTTYAGLHAGIRGYLATVPKLSLSVLSEFSELDDILGHQSLFVASVGTFLQKETQAFLAYSSISHIAFISFGGGLDYAYAYTIIRANI
jgi:formate hydrogenlyase subunit 3/multisubunit Na+/H+ antiporter MnhD subunit